MRSHTCNRPGNVTVLVAVCLTLLLSFTALAIDGGLLLDDRQKAQSAADAAAMAAGNQLFLNWTTSFGLDTTGKAKAAATAAAGASGFTNITVAIPPLSGSYKALPGYAEVVVKYSQKRFFSAIFGSGDVEVAARAVAQGRWSAAKIGVMVLNPTAPGALTLTGGGGMTVVGVPTLVNSNANDAVTATGNGLVTSPEFDIVGNPGISGSGNWQGTIYSGQMPVPDPLAYIPEADPAIMTKQSNHNKHVAGTKNELLLPGVYKGGITVSGQGIVTMAPGIYYMDGGGFTFTGQGSLIAKGVVIVNGPKNKDDVINIAGTGAVTLSPPTSGPYKGISLWQTRKSENQVNVSGNGGSVMSGTFYTAGGTLNVTGNGTNDVIGSQYISDKLVVNGNGTFRVNWDVEQAGQARYLGLVE